MLEKASEVLNMMSSIVGIDYREIEISSYYVQSVCVSLNDSITARVGVSCNLGWFVFRYRQETAVLTCICYGSLSFPLLPSRACLEKSVIVISQDWKNLSYFLVDAAYWLGFIALTPKRINIFWRHSCSIS